MQKRSKFIKKNNFTPYVKARAIDVMHKIMSRPCAKPFIDYFPIKQDTPENPDFHPICLNLIVQRIGDNYYFHPSEWRNDMLLLQSNCETQFGENTSMTKLSHHLMRIFEKEFEVFVCYNLSKWSTLVGILSYQLIFKMLYQAPSEMVITSQIKATLMQNYPYIPECPDYESESEVKTNPDTDETLTDQDETRFLVAVSALRSRQDVKAIAEIISEEQPEVALDDPHASVMVDDLHKSTIDRLIRYTKERFDKLGMNYYQ